MLMGEGVPPSGGARTLAHVRRRDETRRSVPGIGRSRGTTVDSVVDLLQAWLGLAGVGVVLLAGLLYAALRLGWGDFGDVDDEEFAAATAD
jgi:hypothetical protein